MFKSTNDPELTEVWRGANRFDDSAAVIDMLSVALPQVRESDGVQYDFVQETDTEDS
ncbi:MAG: hypothetical protein NT169_22905 [Chloroflexi bacterium]|nr:hypothetical protein [Chloroflexota bacterium]